MTIRTFTMLAAAATIAVGVGVAQQPTNRKPVPKPAMKTVSFKSDVVPLLRKYCLPCHTEDQMNPSELYLDTYENVMASAKHGYPRVVELFAEEIAALDPAQQPERERAWQALVGKLDEVLHVSGCDGAVELSYDDLTSVF